MFCYNKPKNYHKTATRPKNVFPCDFSLILYATYLPLSYPTNAYVDASVYGVCLCFYSVVLVSLVIRIFGLAFGACHCWLVSRFVRSLYVCLFSTVSEKNDFWFINVDEYGLWEEGYMGLNILDNINNINNKRI